MSGSFAEFLAVPAGYLSLDPARFGALWDAVLDRCESLNPEGHSSTRGAAMVDHDGMGVSVVFEVRQPDGPDLIRLVTARETGGCPRVTVRNWIEGEEEHGE